VRYHWPKSVSIFRRTSSFIRMSGGQGRLKPSPGNVFVASMLSLLPMAVSLVRGRGGAVMRRGDFAT
jgi:hypothetical protein